MKPLRVNMLAFESAILKAEKPVLVVFGAMWDSPSRMLFSLLDEYGEKLDWKVITAKADIDYVPELFAEYGVTEIPTMIFFDGGVPFEPQVGYHGFADIDKYFIHPLLHSLKVFVYVLIVNVIFGIMV
jgi:thioredoxin 1